MTQAIQKNPCFQTVLVLVTLRPVAGFQGSAFWRALGPFARRSAAGRSPGSWQSSTATGSTNQAPPCD